jgi:glycosyltransferase involved in cell wall biosynthesis
MREYGLYILFITTYYEPDSGAAAVRLSRLAHQLAARGHQVTVLTTMPHYPQGRISEAYRGKFTTRETLHGVEVVRAWLWATPSPKISRRLLSQMSFMGTLLLRGLTLQRPDVILIESQPMFTNFGGVLLSRLKRVPFVQNVSDLWPDHLLSVGKMTERHPVYRIARALTDATYRAAAKIVAMSPAWAAAIGRYIGTSDKIQVIYNGVDLERFSPQVDSTRFRQQYQLGDAPVIGFIGTFTTQNDFTTMLEAAKHLAKHPRCPLVVFIGTGVQENALQARLAQGDLPHVRYLGWISYDHIPEAWAAIDVMLLALRPERLYSGTIPAKFYEVMAAGVPIAAAIQGVAADIVQHSGAGLVVPCGDAEGLAAAIARLLDDAAVYAQMSQAARAYAEAHFDPQQVVAAYETLLHAALPVSTRSVSPR